MISYYRDGEERSMQANPSTWKYSSKKKVLGNITKSKAGTLLHQYIPKLTTKKRRFTKRCHRRPIAAFFKNAGIGSPKALG